MILVTGSKGKLGGRILAELGADGRGYDLQDGQDILDGHALVAAMRGCQAVVHCAGIPHPGAGEFADYAQTNVWGTLYVCQAAVAVGVRRVVYFSSTAYYGCNAAGGFAPVTLPVDEAHQPNPQGATSAYGASKRMVEEVLRWYGTNGRLETAILRCAPANPKSGQYPQGFDWRACTDYRRKALWANCHPDYAARAAVLAVRHPGPFQGEVFHLCDRYVPDCVDLKAFLAHDYPDLMLYATVEPLASWLTLGRSVFETSQAERMLGWEPCDDRA